MDVSWLGRASIEYSEIRDKPESWPPLPSPSFPLPGEREEKPFSLREKGGDEGKLVI
jgi:hypothetical protein